MRNKGFTLAEILIVLTIVGVLAVMTIPSLVQNANSAQKIAQFKKGFNTISNAYAAEFALKTPPKNTDDFEKMFDALNNQLNVKYYVNAQTGEKLYKLDDIKNISYKRRRVIVTEDGIGYRLSWDNKQNCSTKLNINKQIKTSIALNDYACLEIGVILDNKYLFDDGIYCDDESINGDMQSLEKLNCNTIWLPVASNGITAGNTDCTIAGRIMSDNTTYDASKCSENP